MNDNILTESTNNRFTFADTELITFDINKEAVDDLTNYISRSFDAITNIHDTDYYFIINKDRKEEPLGNLLILNFDIISPLSKEFIVSFGEYVNQITCVEETMKKNIPIITSIQLYDLLYSNNNNKITCDNYNKIVTMLKSTDNNCALLGHNLAYSYSISSNWEYKNIYFLYKHIESLIDKEDKEIYFELIYPWFNKLETYSLDRILPETELI